MGLSNPVNKKCVEMGFDLPSVYSKKSEEGWETTSANLVGVDKCHPWIDDFLVENYGLLIRFHCLLW